MELGIFLIITLAWNPTMSNPHVFNQFSLCDQCTLNDERKCTWLDIIVFSLEISKTLLYTGNVFYKHSMANESQ